MTSPPPSNNNDDTAHLPDDTAPAGLSPGDQLIYQRYVALIDETPYQPVADADMAGYLDAINTARGSNELVDGPAPPLEQAVIDLFCSRRVPPQICRAIVLSYYRTLP